MEKKKMEEQDNLGETKIETMDYYELRENLYGIICKQLETLKRLTETNEILERKILDYIKEAQINEVTLKTFVDAYSKLHEQILKTIELCKEYL